jgi:hypothetical protein
MVTGGAIVKALNRIAAFVAVSIVLFGSGDIVTRLTLAVGLLTLHVIAVRYWVNKKKAQS